MTALATAPEVEVEEALRVADRGDCCGAQAFVITMHEAGPLLWCAHHFKRNERKLPAPIVDHRDRINAKPDTPGDENKEG